MPSSRSQRTCRWSAGLRKSLATSVHSIASGLVSSERPPLYVRGQGKRIRLAAGDVIDLHQQPVLALGQRQFDSRAVGRMHDGEQLFAVQPDFRPVVATDVDGKLRWRLGSDRAVEVQRRVVGQVDIVVPVTIRPVLAFPAVAVILFGEIDFLFGRVGEFKPVVSRPRAVANGPITCQGLNVTPCGVPGSVESEFAFR